MTNEEAIKVLQTYDMSEDNEDKEFIDAVVMAIKALEQEPCEDAISRQAVLEIQSKYAEHVGATKFWQMCDDIKMLPSVKQEPKECTEKEQGKCPYYSG